MLDKFTSCGAIKLLIKLLTQEDTTTKYFVINALACISKMGSKACEKLENEQAVPILMIILRYKLSDVFEGERQPKTHAYMQEMRMEAGIALGNIANSGVHTAVSVLKSGGLELALGVLTDIKDAFDGAFRGTRVEHCSADGLSGGTLEVFHQCCRIIAGIANVAAMRPTPSSPTSRQPHFSHVLMHFLNSGDAVAKMMCDLLDSPFILVKSQACRCLAAIASIRGSGYRSMIMKDESTVQRIVRLALANEDKELQKNSTLCLVSLGFDGGVEDLRVCGESVGSLRDWYRMDTHLEAQCLMSTSVMVTLSCTWYNQLTSDETMRLSPFCSRSEHARGME